MPSTLGPNEAPRVNRWIWSVTFALQQLLPDSRQLENLRKRNALRAARKMKPGGQLEVARRKDLSEEEFVRDYLKKGIPVVFEGQALAWPCTKNWSLEFLRQRYGEEALSVMHLPQIVGDDFRGAAASGGPVVQQVNTGEFVRSVRQGAKSYLRAALLLDQWPELRQDLDLAWLSKMRRSLKSSNIFQSFIGAGERVTQFHCESTENFFILAEGEKRWTFLCESASLFLAPAPSGAGYFFARAKPRKPDEQFPGLDRLTRFSCHLRKGDVLFVPAWAWHEVETLTETWGVAYRFTRIGGLLRNPALSFAFVIEKLRSLSLWGSRGATGLNSVTRT